MIAIQKDNHILFDDYWKLEAELIHEDYHKNNEVKTFGDHVEGLGVGAQITESVKHTWMSTEVEWSDFLHLIPTKPGQDEKNLFYFPFLDF